MAKEFNVEMLINGVKVVGTAQAESYEALKSSLGDVMISTKKEVTEYICRHNSTWYSVNAENSCDAAKAFCDYFGENNVEVFDFTYKDEWDYHEVNADDYEPEVRCLSISPYIEDHPDAYHSYKYRMENGELEFVKEPTPEPEPEPVAEELPETVDGEDYTGVAERLYELFRHIAEIDETHYHMWRHHSDICKVDYQEWDLEYYYDNKLNPIFAEDKSLAELWDLLSKYFPKTRERVFRHADNDVVIDKITNEEKREPLYNGAWRVLPQRWEPKDSWNVTQNFVCGYIKEQFPDAAYVPGKEAYKAIKGISDEVYKDHLKWRRKNGSRFEIPEE